MKLLECVPNVSEGKDLQKIKTLAEVIRNTEGVRLLHVDSGIAANRTVFTFAGEPEKVIEAAFQLYKKAAELIDMRKHKGTHPRQGAVDVCPLIPLQELSMQEAIYYANTLSQRIDSEIKIPGYFYEYSTTDLQRKDLAFLRRGEYESLPEKFTRLPPDFGDPSHWEKSGVTVLGARKLLIAYNVNLNTSDVSVARQIAENIRESGKVSTDHTGHKTCIAGRLKSVKGLGWYIDDFKKAQVSYNLTDIEQAGMLDVFLATRKEAEKLGFEVTGSELVGLAPLSEFLKTARYVMQKSTYFSSALPGTTQEQVNTAIRFLGLDELKPFHAEEKIIEFLIREV